MREREKDRDRDRDREINVHYYETRAVFCPETKTTCNVRKTNRNITESDNVVKKKVPPHFLLLNANTKASTTQQGELLSSSKHALVQYDNLRQYNIRSTWRYRKYLRKREEKKHTVDSCTLLTIHTSDNYVSGGLKNRPKNSERTKINTLKWAE